LDKMALALVVLQGSRAQTLVEPVAERVVELC
jgi:hypothetical protein